MAVTAVCCSYDTDVFEYAERPVVDWNKVEREVKKLGISEFCHVRVEQMMEDWPSKRGNGISMIELLTEFYLHERTKK